MIQMSWKKAARRRRRTPPPPTRGLRGRWAASPRCCLTASGAQLSWRKLRNKLELTGVALRRATASYI